MFLRRVFAQQHSRYRRSLATITAWGAYVGTFAQLPHANPGAGLETNSLDKPTRIKLPLDADSHVCAVGAGVRHALVATTSGSDKGRTRLLGFGTNRQHQLGAPSDSDPGAAFVKTFVDGLVTQIACGREHSALLVSRGSGKASVVTCGANAHGQLGYSQEHDKQNAASKFSWRTVAALESAMRCGEVPTKVQCGLDHTLVLTSLGRVFAMGWGADGQLGAGARSTSDSSDPVNVSGLPNRIVDISASTDFALALDSTGSVYYWGNAEYGQAMTGMPIDQVLLPIRAHLSPPMVKGFAAGGTLSLTVAGKEGSVYVCGYGALGLGPESTSVLEPQRIQSLSAVSQIWASTDRCLALDDSGRLYSWGLANAAGRLGLGSGNKKKISTCLQSRNQFVPEQLDIDSSDIDPELVALGNDIALVAKNHCTAYA
ncbi:hypothetical protein LPJ64_004966 [Coemansia asiatica]|uniref:Uncharacterized protein n=1 Tax=Coemansia asiatica TaxID=1052880 RepID=A0A9W7XI50_9FUNG|nr:hypothetical protein LPJ64_004966 [Coemansia asiatica]